MAVSRSRHRHECSTCRAGNSPGSFFKRIRFGISVSRCKSNDSKSNFQRLYFVDASVKYDATSHLSTGFDRTYSVSRKPPKTATVGTFKENPLCVKAISNPLVPHHTQKPGSKRVAGRTVDLSPSRSGDRLQDCQLDVL